MKKPDYGIPKNQRLGQPKRKNQRPHDERPICRLWLSTAYTSAYMTRRNCTQMELVLLGRRDLLGAIGHRENLLKTKQTHFPVDAIPVRDRTVKTE